MLGAGGAVVTCEDAEFEPCGVAGMMAGAGKLCVGRLGDDRQNDNKVKQSVSSPNCYVPDDYC